MLSFSIRFTTGLIYFAFLYLILFMTRWNRNEREEKIMRKNIKKTGKYFSYREKKEKRKEKETKTCL